MRRASDFRFHKRFKDRAEDVGDNVYEKVRTTKLFDKILNSLYEDCHVSLKTIAYRLELV